MASRKKLRKLVAQALHLGAKDPVVRRELIDGCPNDKTRATLHARIQRAAV